MTIFDGKNSIKTYMSQDLAADVSNPIKFQVPDITLP